MFAWTLKQRQGRHKLLILKGTSHVESVFPYTKIFGLYLQLDLMLVLNTNYQLPTCLLPILTQRAQSNVNKITLTNPQRELSRAIVARFRT